MVTFELGAKLSDTAGSLCADGQKKRRFDKMLGVQSKDLQRISCLPGTPRSTGWSSRVAEQNPGKLRAPRMERRGGAASKHQGAHASSGKLHLVLSSIGGRVTHRILQLIWKTTCQCVSHFCVLLTDHRTCAMEPPTDESGSPFKLKPPYV